MDGEHLAGRSGAEQGPRDPLHRLRRGAFSHADHDGSVADRLHVAAFDVRASPVLVGATQPDRELLGGEHRVEPIDDLHDHRFRLPRGFRHRVQRDPVVDPAGRVALEQEVGQRRQQHARRVGGLPLQPDIPCDIGPRDPPDQELGHESRVRRLHPLAGPLRRRDADLPLVQDVITSPVLDLRLDDRLGEQVFGVVDLDAPLAHHLGERVVFVLGLLHPQHVVEEQLFRIRRRETRMLQSRPVDQHLAEFPDLRMHSERHLASSTRASRRSGRAQRARCRHVHTRGG